jgi:hypothetical protein
MIHGRYSDNSYPANWVVVDILRLEDGILVEHWDVIQDEAKTSASGRPLFGKHFPAQLPAGALTEKMSARLSDGVARPSVNYSAIAATTAD